MTHAKIQKILHAHLATNGCWQPANEAQLSTTRMEWERFADLAIRTAPESRRTEVAQAVKLALDARENGGPGVAADYILRKAAHPMQDGYFLWRAFRITENPAIPVFMGLVSDDLESLKRRVVGCCVVRNFVVEQ